MAGCMGWAVEADRAVEVGEHCTHYYWPHEVAFVDKVIHYGGLTTVRVRLDLHCYFTILNHRKNGPV